MCSSFFQHSKKSSYPISRCYSPNPCKFVLTVAKSTNFVATLHCKSLSTASERLDPVWSNRRWLTKHNLENLETSCANPHKSIQDLSLSFWDFPKTNANRILPKRATHVSESPWTTHKQPKKVLARGWSNFRCVAQLVGVRLRVGWVTRVWNCTVMKFEGAQIERWRIPDFGFSRKGIGKSEEVMQSM